jgi:hypothetical protein
LKPRGARWFLLKLIQTFPLGPRDAQGRALVSRSAARRGYTKNSALVSFWQLY